MPSDLRRRSPFVSTPRKVYDDDLEAYAITAEGILNYKGANTLAVSLWAHDTEGAIIKDIALKFTKKVRSSKPKVKNMDLSGWKRRPGAY